MLLTKNKQYFPEPFETEEEFEKAICAITKELFGENRIYLDCKKKIGKNAHVK